VTFNNIFRHFLGDLLTHSIFNQESGLNIISQFLQLVGLIIFQDAVQNSVTLYKHAFDDLKQILNKV